MSSELIRQVRVLDPASNSDRVADVLIVDGIIEAIEGHIADAPEGTQEYDSPGLVLGSGLVDLYSHSGEPGFESRETLLSLLRSAAAGGFTRIAILPNTNPAIDQPSMVEWMRSQLKGMPHASTQLYYWGALTLGLEGKQMTELTELAAEVVGFADGRPLPSGMLLPRLLEYAQPLHKPIALWGCNADLNAGGAVREGLEALRLGLPGIPAIAETTAIASILECVEALRTPVHLMRVSTARGVELIRTAKARGLPITASTTWMHLLLDITAVASYDPSLHLDPPLGNPEDRQALVQGLREGVLDAIAVDHTPYTYEEKTVAFAESPPGAIGLELALPLLWETFVSSQQWSALELWQYLSTRPAQCLGQSPAIVQPGKAAELALFDPTLSWEVTPQSLKSYSTNTPWLGQSITGRVIQTWGGQV
ncbi:dihydroorotase [Oscillatoria sp. FACHB-1407]|uniref:dihydroorotase n=1 Tax=Oscillatoria sp. FACHB-1407 TaxID=2692847 RepID=UPI001683A1D8|nr:dihydroorotase [Oscillatoria sp. FACHB-1407]MBD2462708.1 dihydroorotase [Oscillatoria sp. FACHB-1407]